MDLRSSQFESIFGRNLLERYRLVGQSYYHCFMEHAYVLTYRVWVLLEFFFQVFFHSSVPPTYFYVDLCTRGQEKLQERLYIFNPYLAPLHGAFQGTSTPEGPSARET